MASPKARPFRWQRGGYAIEYALIFPFLFVVAYEVLSLALVFTVHMGLQYAAEEGARAALRYQAGASYTNKIDSRRQTAKTVAVAQTNWLPVAPTVASAVCVLGTTGTTCNPVTTATSSPPTCGNDIAGACEIVVEARYNYAAHPILPALPALGALLPSSFLPSNMRGRATVLVDGNTLNL